MHDVGIGTVHIIPIKPTYMAHGSNRRELETYEIESDGN